MKILVLTTTFPRWKGDSTPAFVYELSKRLKDENTDIVVLAPHHEGARKFEIMDGIKIYRFPYFYPYKYQKLAYGGGILPSIKKSHLAKIQVPFLFISELYYTFKIVREEQIDVIHSHWIIPSGIIGGICKKILKKRHVLTEHAAGVAALRKLPLKENITKFIFENSDSVTVVSNYVKERLLNLVIDDTFDKNKINIIPMGVDTKIFKQDIDKNELKKRYNIESENILIFIGRIAEKKGLSYLINAMPNIISKNPNTLLLVCGDGPLRNEYEGLAKKMSIEKFVRFTGFISDHEKIDYLSLSDILIVPSIVAQSGDTEGLPVVILEGLSSGKSIIASNVGGVSDAIKDDYNGFLVEQKDSKHIADKVLMLINNKDKMNGLSQNSIISSKRYDWKIIAKSFSNTIKNCER